MSSVDDGGTPSLMIEFGEAAETHLEDAYAWLISLPMGGEGGFAIAERWLSGLQRALLEEAALLAGEPPIRRPLAPESSPQRERFTLLYRTAGRRSSPWRIVYELLDSDNDGQMDTLRVVSVRHAARL